MWAVSTQFLEALRFPHTIKSTFSYTVPGGTAKVLQVESGSVSNDWGARIRRTSSLTVQGSQADYVAITMPGTVFRISHGLVMGNTTELIPVFTGEQVNGEQQFGNGIISLSLADHANWLSRSRFLVPYAPDPALTRVAAIEQIVTAGKPGVTVLNVSSDEGIVGIQNVWTDSRLDAITALCRDGNIDGFFRPDGVFVIQDMPTISTPHVWTVSGIVESGARKRPMDKLYNTVIVRPSASDGSQTWTQQTASISDTSNDRHPNYIGIVPYFLASPTASSEAVALEMAQNFLYKVMGTTETLSLGIISNPAMESGDVLRIIAPPVGSDPANIFQHFVDGFSLDLNSGSMTVNTRSQIVETD
jgi:hypothetical protein